MKRLSDDHETKRLFVPVTQDMRERLKAKCAEDGIPVAEKVRELVGEYLDPSLSRSNLSS